MKRIHDLFASVFLFDYSRVKLWLSRIGVFCILMSLVALHEHLKENTNTPLINAYKAMAFLVFVVLFFELDRSFLTLLKRIAKSDLTDGLLLFVCNPDDAEATAGDLIEELEKVKAQHGTWYCRIWFFWALVWIVALKGGKRFTKSVFGSIADLWKRKSG